MLNSHKIILYRMVLPEHTCPFGVRAVQMLEQNGMNFEDRILSSREKVEAFKTEHNVRTTPLIFVDGEPIGGSEELEIYLANQDAQA